MSNDRGERSKLELGRKAQGHFMTHAKKPTFQVHVLQPRERPQLDDERYDFRTERWGFPKTTLPSR
jgi:hypothetical protein